MVRYVTYEEPIKVGEYDGDDILAFGHYRVELGDFVYMQPHSGFQGTVSEEPEPCSDPEVRESLIRLAEKARDDATA